MIETLVDTVFSRLGNALQVVTAPQIITLLSHKYRHSNSKCTASSDHIKSIARIAWLVR